MKEIKIIALFFFSCMMRAFSPIMQADEPVRIRESRIDSVLVSVNGEPITLLDVILETGGREKELAGIYSGERLFTETRTLRKDTLEQIVFRKLVYEKYKAEPFDIPKQEVENLLDEFVRTSGAESRSSLEKSLIPFGISKERLREQAKERIAVEIMLRRDCDYLAFVSPKEIYEDYAAHREKWTKPAQITLQLLQISVVAGVGGNNPEAVAKAVQEELKNDSSQKNFTRLVLAYSDAATASDGGIMENIEHNKLRPEFISALEGKVPGDVVGPIKTPEAFYFLRILGNEPEKLVPFREASEEVMDALYRKRVAEKRKEYTEKMRRDAVIRYFDN